MHMPKSKLPQVYDMVLLRNHSFIRAPSAVRTGALHENWRGQHAKLRMFGQFKAQNVRNHRFYGLRAANPHAVQARDCSTHLSAPLSALLRAHRGFLRDDLRAIRWVLHGFTLIFMVFPLNFHGFQRRFMDFSLIFALT